MLLITPIKQKQNLGLIHLFLSLQESLCKMLFLALVQNITTPGTNELELNTHTQVNQVQVNGIL